MYDLYYSDRWQGKVNNRYIEFVSDEEYFEYVEERENERKSDLNSIGSDSIDTLNTCA